MEKGYDPAVLDGATRKMVEKEWKDPIRRIKGIGLIISNT
jgi:hypothetical protein